MLLVRVQRGPGAQRRAAARSVRAGRRVAGHGRPVPEDADGDYWRVDGAGEVIHTSDGPVFTVPICDALSELPAIGLAVAYGMRVSGEEHELAIAAVTLRDGHELTAREIARALSVLERHHRPAIVYVVDRIPVTTWHRPLTGPLRAAGVPEPGEQVRAWYRDASGEVYRPLSAAAHKRLLGG